MGSPADVLERVAADFPTHAVGRSAAAIISWMKSNPQFQKPLHFFPAPRIRDRDADSVLRMMPGAIDVLKHRLHRKIPLQFENLDEMFQRLTHAMSPNPHWAHQQSSPFNLRDILLLEALGEITWSSSAFDVCTIPQCEQHPFETENDAKWAYYLISRRGGDHLKDPLWTWHIHNKALGIKDDVFESNTVPIGIAYDNNSVRLGFCGSFHEGKIRDLIADKQAMTIDFVYEVDTSLREPGRFRFRSFAKSVKLDRMCLSHVAACDMVQEAERRRREAFAILDEIAGGYRF